MRFFCLAFVALMVGTPAMAQDADRSVEDGGVKVDGWKARIDRRPIRQGMSTTDSKFSAEGDAFRLSISFRCMADRLCAAAKTFFQLASSYSVILFNPP